MGRVTFFVAVFLGMSVSARAATIVVDGSLSDWSVNVSDNNGSTYPASAVAAGLLGIHVEDTDDLATDSFFLGPNHGGQNYDAEFMGVARGDGANANTLYVSIVTGQRPDNGVARYSPGDIRITTDAGLTYGIEVGGGLGHDGGLAMAAILGGAAGTTYNLTAAGYTDTGSPLIPTDGSQTVGSIWRQPTWIDDPIAPQDPVQMQFTGGTLVGDADFIFTLDSVTTQHSIMELAFDMNLIEGGITGLYWRPSCGNDELNILFADSLTLHSAPLPGGAGLGLVGLGILAFGRMWRRSRRLWVRELA